MYRSLCFYSLVACTIFYVSLAFPLTPPLSSSLSSQSGVNCSDLNWNLTQPCWDELDVSTYITTWWETNNRTCNEHNATFASCYQQMAGTVEQQCDTTGPGMCQFPTSFVAYSPQEAYVLYAIFAIWQWFESIFEAIGGADLTSTGPVGDIVRTINPPKPTTQSLGDFFQALSALTPLIKFPASIEKYVANSIETGLRQSPGVLKQLNPSGTLDSEVVQINKIYDGLSTIQSTYQANISVALALVQTDVTTFSEFAAHGYFIAPRISLEAQTVNLTAALKTYIVSQCLSQNNIIMTLNRETNPQALATNGSLTEPQLVNCTSYDQHGVCDDWWYDSGTNAAFGLSSLNNPQRSYHDLMESIFSSGWTTPQDLFLGSKSCADYVAVNGGNSTPYLDVTNMAARCMSNTQICVFNSSCGVNDPKCEYTGEYGWDLCKPQTGYQTSECAVDEGMPSTMVPAAYLGPMDYIQDDAMVVCNS